jgi:acetylornithine deacetylase/succinyl-diaminopimelate desuccinylase-like protein
MAFDLLQAAEALIAADTVSAHGNQAAVPLLRSLAAQVGLVTEVLPAPRDGERNTNLLFQPDGRRPRTVALLLLTHTDTVDPGPLAAWTVTPPFQARRDGDRLYGLGSADAKVDLLAKLIAADRFRDRTLAQGFCLLGTYGEEIGLLGAKEFVRSGRVRPRFVVCGEPSDLTIIHAHKGYLVARVELGPEADAAAVAGTAVSVSESRTYQGRAAHSSTPGLGENAIEKALRDPESFGLGKKPLTPVFALGGQGANSVAASCELGFGEGLALPLAEARAVIDRWHSLIGALSPDRDDRFDPPRAASNVGFISGEHGQLTLLLDARLLPGHSPEAVAAAFEEEVRALGGRVRFERQNPAVYTDPRGELCRAAQAASGALGLPTALATKATNTEAAAFTGQAEAIVFGPGTSRGNAHCPNEHTSLAQLSKAVDWYERLIAHLCL